MSETKRRLGKCFETAFPELVGTAVYEADQAKVKSWDSVGALTLVSVIEEEFQIQMDYEMLERLTTFDLVLEHLRQAHSLPE